jgi:hypothetical protein
MYEHLLTFSLTINLSLFYLCLIRRIWRLTHPHPTRRISHE